jgi:hypothetical protein
MNEDKKKTKEMADTDHIGPISARRQGK